MISGYRTIFTLLFISVGMFFLARCDEKPQAAQALVEEAQTQLAEVESYEVDLKLLSPIDGEVQKVLSHEGELDGVRPGMTASLLKL